MILFDPLSGTFVSSGGGGSGSVTSVGITAPSILTVTNSPITTSGDIDLSLAVQNANKVFAGPASGADAQPTFRALVALDIPALAYDASGSAAAAQAFAIQRANHTGTQAAATISDLSTTTVPEGTNLYFTDARAIAAPLTGYTSGAGTVAATDSILQAIQKLNGNSVDGLATKWSLSGNGGTGGTGKIGTTDAQNFDIIAGNSTIATIVESYKGISAAPTIIPVDSTGVNQFDWRTYVNPTSSTTGASHANIYSSLIWDNPNAGFGNTSGSLIASNNNFSHNGSGTINYASTNTNSAGFNSAGVTTQFKGVTSENQIAAGATVTDYYGIVSGLTTTGGILGTHNGISQYSNFVDTTFSAQSNGITNSDLYSGTTTLAQGVTGFNSYLQFDDTTTITNQIQGFSSGITLNDDIIANGLVGSNVNVQVNDNAAAGGINLNSISLGQQGASTSNGVNGYNANLQFSGTSSTTGVNIVSLYARTSDTADLDSLNVINCNPEIEGSSTVDNINLLAISGQIRGSAVVQNLSGGYINPQMSGSAVVTNFTGLSIQPQVNGTSTLTNVLTGLQVQPQGTVAVNGVTGISVDMSGITLDAAYIAAGGQKKGLTINDGQIDAGHVYTLPGTSGFFQQHYIGGSVVVANGDPASAFGFGMNLAQGVVLHDDWTLDGAGLGFCAGGFVGSLEFDAGTTMARWTGALGGSGNPSGAGTLTDAIMFRAAGILPQGGALTVTNAYGFQVDPNLFGLTGTNSWGFYEDNSAVQNHVSKLAIGTANKKVTNSDTALEIGNSKMLLLGSGSTAVKSALTPIESGLFYDSTLKQFQFYNGTSWVSPSGGTYDQYDGTSLIDNANQDFVLPNTPIQAKAVWVYFNGVFQLEGVGYTIAGATITTIPTLTVGETLDVVYIY